MIGYDAAAFAAVAEWFGSEVVSIGVAEDVAVRIGTPGAPAPQPAPAPQLQFANSCFDTIFLGSQLEWARRLADGTTSVRQAQAALLEECWRVLKPGGTLLAAVDNRFSITAWAGKPHPATGLRFLDLLPRLSQSVLPKRIREKARWHRSYSYRGWTKLFNRLEFSQVTWRALWPSVEHWRDALPLLPKVATDLGTFREPTYRARVANWLLRGLRALSVQHHAATGYLVVARKCGPLSESPRSPLVEEIAASAAERLDDRVVVSALWNSGSVRFVTGGTFFKVPIHASALPKLEHEAAAAAKLALHPVARYMPLPARLHTARGVPYLACPAITPDTEHNLTESAAVEFLDALHHGAMPVPLSATDFWQAVFRPAVHRELVSWGGAPVLKYLAGSLGNRHVRSGIVHGDLHRNNFMAAAGRTFVVDWDRFAECSPLFFNTFEIVVTLARDSCNRDIKPSLLDVLERILERDPTLPLYRRLCQHDDLSMSEMVTCFLVHRASRHAGRSDFTTSPSQRGLCQAWLALAERLLPAHAATHSGERPTQRIA